MSDWYRSGRDHDQGRHGAESRERRDFGGQDRWRGQEGRGQEGRGQDWRGQDRRGAEQRSFEERHPDPARGGFTGMSYGEADFMPQDQGGRDFRGETYGAGGQRGQPWGSRGAQDERRAYGPEGRSQDWGRSPYAREGSMETGGREQGGRQGYGEQRYGGQQGQGVVGVNPVLQRVTDGEHEHDMRQNMRMGEHRGRGPKNYTRSDERIREDVNDRLSDDSWLDASEIEVQVSSCEVTLTGMVQSRDDKRRAEDLAEQVSGVRHVQNNLRVQPHPTQNPRDVPANAGGTAPPVT